MANVISFEDFHKSAQLLSTKDFKRSCKTFKDNIEGCKKVHTTKIFKRLADDLLSFLETEITRMEEQGTFDREQFEAKSEKVERYLGQGFILSLYAGLKSTYMLYKFNHFVLSTSVALNKTRSLTDREKKNINLQKENVKKAKKQLLEISSDLKPYMRRYANAHLSKLNELNRWLALELNKPINELPKANRIKQHTDALFKLLFSTFDRSLLSWRDRLRVMRLLKANK